MTYGLQVENDAGQLVLLDENHAPWMCGKATVSSTGSFGDDGGAYERAVITYSVPGSGRRLLAITLPVDSGEIWYQAEPLLVSGSSFNLMAFRVLGSTDTFTAPELYAFALETAPTASTGYGMQIFNSSGVLIFDTGSSPVAPKQILTHTIPTTGASLAGLPSKPCFILPNTDKTILVSTGPLTSDLNSYAGAFRRPTSSTLSSALLHYHYEGVDAAFDETLTYGRLTSQAIVIMDAALYD